MSDHQVWNELGNVYIISNEPEKALTAYKKALELNPESGWTHNNIALSYIRLADPEKAIEHYQRSIELFDDFADKAEVWHRLGTAYQMTGDTKNTLLAFERATALAPENTEYKASILELLENEHQGGNGSEPVVPVPMLSGSEVAPMVASVPLELKKKLIPISVEEEEENIDLDPGVEELMNELSSVIEREVSESIEEAETPVLLDEEDAQETEEESGKSPKWLDFDKEAESDDQPEALAATSEASEAEAEVESHGDITEEKNVSADPDIPMGELSGDDVDEDLLYNEENADESDLELEEEAKEDEWGDDEDDIDFAAELEADDEDDDEFDSEYEFDDDDLDVEEDDDHDAELKADEEAMLLKQKAVAEKDEEPHDKEEADDTDNTKDVMQNAAVWGEMGNVFFNSDVYDGALIAYRKALELDGNYGAVMHNLALLSMHRGEYDQAVDLYQKSIELLHDPSAQATSWNNLGNAYRTLGDYESAGEAYRKADELTNRDVSAQAWKYQELLSTKSA